MRYTWAFRAWAFVAVPTLLSSWGALRLRMALDVKTLQNQVMRNPRVRVGGGYTVMAISPKQLELIASAFSPSKFATSLGKSLMKGNSIDLMGGK